MYIISFISWNYSSVQLRFLDFPEKEKWFMYAIWFKALKLRSGFLISNIKYKNTDNVFNKIETEKRNIEHRGSIKIFRINWTVSIDYLVEVDELTEIL